MDWKYNDGGRSRYYQAKNVNDCVVRSIAIACGLDYKEVYDTAKTICGVSPRNGLYKKDVAKLMAHYGAKWVPCSGIGQSKKTHLRNGELPQKGRLVCKVTKHLTAVIDGVINDTHDPSRQGARLVYGYWIFNNFNN